MNPADPVRRAAFEAIEYGICTFPPKEDGSKAPDGAWKRFESERSTAEDVRLWYGESDDAGPANRTGFGAICGKVSGNLEVLEFDAGGEVYERFKARARALGLGDLVVCVEAGYLERSPSGGVHWLYRCETVEGNTKLAHRNKTPAEFNQADLEAIERARAKGKEHKPVQVLVETRGEGGFIVLAPSNGKVHPSGGRYELLRGGLATIATITPEERELLWNLARSFDETGDDEGSRAEEEAKRKRPDDWPDILTPWDDYNARARWPDLLAGWTVAFRDGETEYLLRPGKTRGHSATLNRGGSDRLFVFSSSTEFETGTPYTKFAAYARREHRDDFKAATRALSEAGYGRYKTWVRVGGEWTLETRQNPCPKGVRIARPGDGPPVTAAWGDDESSRGTEPGSVEEPAPWPPLRLDRTTPAPPFPVEVFPLAVQSYCREVAAAMLAPVDFVAAAVLAAAGAAVGQSVNIRVKRGWAEAPVLYVVLVSKPGKTKSPVIRAVVKRLAEVDRRLRKESREASERWQEAKKQHEKDPKKHLPPGEDPPQRRAIVKDVTRESLVIILEDNPRGVLCDPDEASAWVGSFNEYKRGGADRQFWLSVWSCAPVSVDRKGGRESHHVPFPFISVLGGLPPAMLGSLIEERGRDDGFLDRILFSYPEDDAFPSQVWTEAELSEESEKAWGDVLERLHATDMTPDEGSERGRPFYVGFTPEAKREWVEWFNAHSAETNDSEFPEDRAGAWSKMRAHAARFALILSRLRWACDTESRGNPEPVVAKDVRGAVAIVDYFKGHLVRVRHEMTGGVYSGDARSILEWARRRARASFRAAEVGVDLRRFRENPRALSEALAALERMGLIRPSRPEARRPGRRPSQGYDVHPELLTAPGNSKTPGNEPGSGPDTPEGGPDSPFSGLTEFPGAHDENATDREDFDL